MNANKFRISGKNDWRSNRVVALSMKGGHFPSPSQLSRIVRAATVMERVTRETRLVTRAALTGG